jgi:hypothetical protein
MDYWTGTPCSASRARLARLSNEAFRIVRDRGHFDFDSWHRLSDRPMEND